MSKPSTTRSAWLDIVQELAGFLIAGLMTLTSGIKISAEERHDQPSKDLLTELKTYPHKIVYESNRDGNWELYLVNADGSDPVNLTRTPDVDELYPKPSPDGSKICFVADEGKGDAKVRGVNDWNGD